MKEHIKYFRFHIGETVSNSIGKNNIDAFLEAWNSCKDKIINPLIQVLPVKVSGSVQEYFKKLIVRIGHGTKISWKALAKIKCFTLY